MENFILVDDDPTCNYLVEFNIHLLSPDSTFKSVVDPIQALSYIYSGDIFYPKPIIFLNLNMPRMTGWEFLEIVRLLNIPCSIYIVTSSVDDDVKYRAKNYPVVKGYMAKPILDADIEKIIRQKDALNIDRKSVV